MRTIWAVLVLAPLATAQPPAAVTVVSAASFSPGTVAPGMLATAFSAAITGTSGYAVAVGESPAQVLATASGQVNFVVPAGLPLGAAPVAVTSAGRVVASGSVTVAAVAPGIFTANASGTGAPAALFVTAGPDGSRETGELFAASQGGGFLPRPFATGTGDVFLTLFGTGIRGRRNAVTAMIGAETVPVAAVAAQSEFAGLDQVNLGPLPARFADQRGELDLLVTVDGIAANPVTVAPNGPSMDAWAARAGLIDANSEMAVGEVGGRIFVMGGYPASRQTQATVQIYDPAADRWELGPPMPVALNHNMTATVNAKLYVIGGQLTEGGAGNFSDRVFEYDPAARQWRERSRMPTARGGGVAVALDGKIYVAGSRPPRGADFAVYDPALDTWRTLADMPTQRNHLAGAAVGGKVYIIGGRFEAGFQSPQTDAVEVYDPATNTWAKRSSMPKPRGGINGVAAYGCLHIWGGEGNAAAPSGVYPDHDIYNPITDRWTSLDPLPVPVHGVTGAVFLRGLIYLPGGGTAIGGSSGSRHHQVYRPTAVCR